MYKITEYTVILQIYPSSIKRPAGKPHLLLNWLVPTHIYQPHKSECQCVSLTAVLEKISLFSHHFRNRNYCFTMSRISLQEQCIFSVKMSKLYYKANLIYIMSVEGKVKKKTCKKDKSDSYFKHTVEHILKRRGPDLRQTSESHLRAHRSLHL